MKRLFAYLIIGAMVLGVLAGWGLNQFLSPEQAKAAAGNLNLVTDIFLRLIKMIIAPLVFTTLIAGIAHMEDAASVGRIGAKTMGWFICASIVSGACAPRRRRTRSRCCVAPASHCPRTRILRLRRRSRRGSRSTPRASAS